MGVANSSGRIPLESAWDAPPLLTSNTSSWAPSGANWPRGRAEEETAAQRRAAAATQAKPGKPPGYVWAHKRKPESKENNPDLLSYGPGTSKWAQKRDHPHQQQPAARVTPPPPKATVYKDRRWSGRTPTARSG